VLRPGGWFLGSDSTPSLVFRLAHLFDTMVLVDADSFGARLERAGFGEVRITGNYTDAAPTDGDHVLGLCATR
jgi:hypothetical protein